MKSFLIAATVFAAIVFGLVMPSISEAGGFVQRQIVVDRFGRQFIVQQPVVQQQFVQQPVIRRQFVRQPVVIRRQFVQPQFVRQPRVFITTPFFTFIR